METSKLEYQSLDLVFAAAMWNKPVPNILQGNTRVPACIFKQKTLIYCISTNQGPELSATCTGTNLSTLSARMTVLGALGENPCRVAIHLNCVKFYLFLLRI
jgi:hypothetical protein